jgi:hypothetical protein
MEVLAVLEQAEVTVAGEDAHVLGISGTRQEARVKRQSSSTPRWAPNLVVVAASGDVAHAIGTYELSLKDADGNTISAKGKWLDTFQKQADGSWKISAISDNSDRPVE